LPKVRSLLSANWIYRAFTTTYLVHYTGSYVDPTIPGGVSVGSYVTHDIQFNIDCGKLVSAKSWMSRVSLTFGVEDFTDAKVPIFYGGEPGGFQATGYDPSIVNPTGRFFYAAVHVAFPRRR
jgi:hypothetical protein